MNYRYTRHQTARLALPDRETRTEMFLIKNTPTLALTYQILQLLNNAVLKKKKLIIELPAGATVEENLRETLKAYPKVLEIRRVL